MTNARARRGGWRASGQDSQQKQHSCGTGYCFHPTFSPWRCVTQNTRATFHINVIHYSPGGRRQVGAQAGWGDQLVRA